ncbi:MAG: hypothetical protein ACOYYS_01405 [Chloroflexota bacterium]
MKKRNPSPPVLATAVALIAAISAIYVLLYQAQPLPQPWNDVGTYLIFVLAAALAALAATLVAFRFHKTDKPRLVWVWFATGLWSWALAELIWMIYALTMDEIPALTPADILWVGAYGFFALSFVHQYYLIFSPTIRKSILWLVGITGAVLLLAGALTTALYRFGGESEQAWFETFVTVFYAVGDLAVGLVALRLSQLFGRGLWGRVWWGLIFFALSDALYSWLEFSGIYAVSVETGNPLSLITDVVYFDAYLVVGLACLSQWLLMRYGPVRRQRVGVTAGDTCA